MRLVRPGLLALTLGVASLFMSSAPAYAAPPLPDSMASMGDSISRGFNACGFYIDCTARSFSTGDDGSIKSHYLRIRAKNGTISGHNYNVARSGAKAADMPGQADAAVARGVQYVTMLIGGNDACTSSESTMTQVDAFRGSIDTALAKIKAGLPTAKVFIISVPDIWQLWYIGKDSASARNTWGLFGICKAMLANPTSTAAADVGRRDRVRQRVVAFNTQLAQACAAYGPNCRWDDNAIYSYRFTLSQVSPWDYFHPNASGQAVLAEISYAAGFNW
jgi:lysophospholipase L1-like esterase